MLLALLLAGCGGGEREQAPQPKLSRPLATQLAARSDRVAARLEANDPCGARAEAEALQQQAIAAVNERRIPTRYLEELTSAVNALAVSIVCVSPPPQSEEDEDDAEDDDEGKGKGKGKSKGKGKGRRSEDDD